MWLRELTDPRNLQDWENEKCQEAGGRTGQKVRRDECVRQSCLWLWDSILKMKFKTHVGVPVNWNVCLLAFPKGEQNN